ncbi:MAG: cytochrome c peroxidase [Alcanivorax sp.]|jgi:cytochrome c peroxidase
MTANTTVNKFWLTPACHAAALILSMALVVRVSASEIKLSTHCPPYFQLQQDNTCTLASLYDAYPAAHELWGGYRVALPARRDGFSPQQIDLGRYLFFDPILSADQDLSCAHCHHPNFTLADSLGTSIGRHGAGLGPARQGGSALPRSAPPLWNLAFQQTFFWDSRAATLEDQIETVLITAEEMATTPDEMVTRVTAIPAYRRMFQEAFATEEISYTQVLEALVAFETSLVSLSSRYDLYIHGAQDALNNQELNGLNIFRSFASRCSQCHTPPLFTSGQLASTGVPAPISGKFDPGAQTATGEPSLRGAFKVPTLRNIALTAPYMHAGQFSTLEEAIAFYNAEPGHAVPAESGLTLHWHMNNPDLREDELQDLIAFLETLTDTTALPAVPDALPSGIAVPK